MADEEAEESQGIAEGTTFGRYRIVRQIGRGGMGAVYEAVHLDLEKRVALKVLLPSSAPQGELVARFEREGRAAAKIRHPNVVDVSDVGVEEGMPFLVMEYLEGEDLSRLLRREGALPLARVAAVMLPVLGAVAAAHAQGVVHRDLKPENIFLARLGDGAVVPKVLDFGISKTAPRGAGPALTGTGIMMGTPCYMSPEQAMSSRGVDGQSDQFALGVILYECATGRRPFEGETLFAILKAIVDGTYARPREVRPDLPERFDAALVRALQVAPDARFPSVTALADELRACASQPAAATPRSEIALAETMAAGEVPAPTVLLAAAVRPVAAVGARRRARWIGLALGAAVLLGLVAGVANSMTGPRAAASASSTPVAAPVEVPAAALAAEEEAPTAATEPAVAPSRGGGHGRGHGHTRGRHRRDD